MIDRVTFRSKVSELSPSLSLRSLKRIVPDLTLVVVGITKAYDLMREKGS